MRPIQAWGWVGLSVGVFWLLIAFNMDTSVATNSGFGFPDRVENLGLMAERQNHIIVSCFVCLVGILAIIFGGQRLNSPLSIPEQTEAIVTPPPDRDLNSDAYKLWLTKHYKVERNDVLNRFVIGDKTFETLDDTFAYADSREREKIEKERSEREKIAESQKLLEAENKGRDEKYDKVFKVSVLIIIAAILVATPFLYIADQKRREDEVRQSNALLRQMGFIRSADMTDVTVEKVTAESKNTFCDNNRGALVTFKSTNSPDSIIYEVSKGAETHNPYSDDSTLTVRKFQDDHGTPFSVTVSHDNPAYVYLCRIEN